MEQVGVEKTEVVVRAVEGAAKALGVAAETAARVEVVRAEATEVVAREGGRAGAGVEDRAVTRAAARAAERAGRAVPS